MSDVKERWFRKALSPLSLSFVVCAGFALVAWGLPWVFVDQPGSELASIILVVGGTYFGFLKKDSSGSNGIWLRRGMGAVFVLAGILIPWGNQPEAAMPWQKYDEALLVEAQEKGIPVMIDFTAAWCGPCQVMERQVFSRKKIVEAAERFLPLKADLTDSNDPKVQAIAEKFSIVAFPTVVFIGPDGKERSKLRLVGVEWADRFEGRLAAVK